MREYLFRLLHHPLFYPVESPTDTVDDIYEPLSVFLICAIVSAGPYYFLWGAAGALGWVMASFLSLCVLRLCVTRTLMRLVKRPTLATVGFAQFSGLMYVGAGEVLISFTLARYAFGWHG